MVPRNLFKSVDFIGILTLARRKDRLGQLMQHLRELGIAHRTFSHNGIDVRSVAGNGHPGVVQLADMACGAGHRYLIALAKEVGAGNILVLEDDAAPYMKNMSRFPKVMKQLEPLNWKTFNLGGCRANWRPATPAFASFPLAENVVEVKGMVTTHAILYHSSVFDDILVSCPSEMEVLGNVEHRTLSNPRPYDQWLSGLGGMVTSTVPFFYQSGASSDIIGMPHGSSVKEVIDETYESIRQAIPGS